jgi:hypothetical protein
VTARLEGTTKKEDYGEDGTGEVEEELKKGVTEALIQWP